MKRTLLLPVLFAASLVYAQPGRISVLDGDNLARQLTVMSIREDLAENDKRIAQTRAWLDKVVKTTGEDEKAVAATCQRTAKFIIDSTRSRATPLEVLEGLALHVKAGQPMPDTTLAYVNARRQSADKSHAAALAALAARQ